MKDTEHTYALNLIKSLSIGISRYGKGSEAEKGYITEKLIKLIRWYEEQFTEVVLLDGWRLF